MAQGDMNNYKRKQLEFETEQVLKYVTMYFSSYFILSC